MPTAAAALSSSLAPLGLLLDRQLVAQLAFLGRSLEKMRPALFACTLALGFSWSAFGGLVAPSLTNDRFREVAPRGDVFVAEVASVEQKVIYKQKEVSEDLSTIEGKLLKLMENDPEGAKQFVLDSKVVTTVVLKIRKKIAGKKDAGESVTLTIVDEVGSLCPHHMQLPIRDNWLKKHHVWALYHEEIPQGVKVTTHAWTTIPAWQSWTE